MRNHIVIGVQGGGEGAQSALPASSPSTSATIFRWHLQNHTHWARRPAVPWLPAS
ncbi:hypothetical protein [Nonomuraea sp. NPDC050310]|uniref:hypothetical protein n=1 Tax=Nonomuraea sp. NPDC050310 TaxID=3154935 RepID=UPI0034079BDF